MSLSPKSSVVQHTIDMNYANSKRSSSLKWVFVNLVLFMVFAYDFCCKCEGYTGVLHYVELCVAGVAGANALQHCARLARGGGGGRRAALALSPAQARLLGVRAPLGGLAAPAPRPAPSTPEPPPGELSPRRVWRSDDASPPPSPPSPPSPRADRPPPDHFIADSHTLANYLREVEARSRTESGASEAWCGVAVCAGGAGVAGTAGTAGGYQTAAGSAGGGEQRLGGAGGAGGAGAAWRRVALQPARLEQCALNLRVWLHATIVSRVARELDAADAALAAAGLPDARLASLSPALLPSLPALAPYLEPFADQRYVAQRIRELAAGGCLSNYRWNGGGSEWEESKPTDAELVLHLVATYLDAQLPAAGGARPFSSTHLTAGPAPPRSPAALAIHRVAQRPPQYALLLGEELLEVARGRNNLLHTLLLFLAAAARSDPPALRRMHLGPAGLNMLWIIGR